MDPTSHSARKKDVFAIGRRILRSKGVGRISTGCGGVHFNSARTVVAISTRMNKNIMIKRRGPRELNDIAHRRIQYVGNVKAPVHLQDFLSRNQAHLCRRHAGKQRYHDYQQFRHGHKPKIIVSHLHVRYSHQSINQSINQSIDQCWCRSLIVARVVATPMAFDCVW
jgi:hypothetical protein